MDRSEVELSQRSVASANDTNSGSGESLLSFDCSSAAIDASLNTRAVVRQPKALRTGSHGTTW